MLAHPVAELAPAGREDLVEQIVAADRLDRGQQAGRQGVVVGREHVLGIGRDVVQVARPADPVANGLAADEIGGLERPELLEDAGPARPEPLGELVGGAGPVESKTQQQVAPQVRWPVGRSLAERPGRRGRGASQARQRLPHPGKASTGHPRGAVRVLRSTSMDLDLSPEHTLLRETIRDFMLTEVAPVIDEHERERRFPTEIVRRIGELGWLGIPIPEDEGGAGLDTLAYAIAIEEIGRVWGSLGLIVAAHTSLGCGPLHLAGSHEQQQRSSSRWRRARSSARTG